MATGHETKNPPDVNSSGTHLKNTDRLDLTKLSSLHVFCKQCFPHLLTDRVASNLHLPQQVICPVCKMKTAIPSSCSVNLPLYFHSWKGEDTTTKPLEGGFAICKCCQSDTQKVCISSYCVTCPSGLCDDCCKKHDKCHKNHTRIAASPSKMKCMMCQDHNSHFDHLCFKCDQVICAQCYIGVHSEHNVHALIYDNKQVGDDLTHVLQHQLESADEDLIRLDNLQKEIKADIKKIRSEINERYKALSKQLEDQYQSSCLVLDDTQEALINEINQSKQRQEDGKISIKRFLEENAVWLTPLKGVPEAHVADVKEMVSEVKHKMPNIDASFVRVPKLKFAPGNENIDFGKVIKDGNVH